MSNDKELPDRKAETGYPHVTDVIKLVRPMDFTPEAALTRGRLVHRACALLDGWGDGSGLDLASLHPVLVPYVDAYLLFLKAWKPDYIWVEHQFANDKYRYQGRIDRLTPTDIFDLKCGGDKHKATGLQLSGYERGFGTKNRRRFAIHLLPNGRFFVEDYRDRADWPVFLGLLQIHQWRVRHGLVAESRDTGDRGI